MFWNFELYFRVLGLTGERVQPGAPAGALHGEVGVLTHQSLTDSPKGAPLLTLRSHLRVSPIWLSASIFALCLQFPSVRRGCLPPCALLQRDTALASESK